MGLRPDLPDMPMQLRRLRAVLNELPAGPRPIGDSLPDVLAHLRAATARDLRRTASELCRLADTIDPDGAR